MGWCLREVLTLPHHTIKLFKNHSYKIQWLRSVSVLSSRSWIVWRSLNVLHSNKSWIDQYFKGRIQFETGNRCREEMEITRNHGFILHQKRYRIGDSNDHKPYLFQRSNLPYSLSTQNDHRLKQNQNSSVYFFNWNICDQRKCLHRDQI